MLTITDLIEKIIIIKNYQENILLGKIISDEIKFKSKIKKEYI